MSRFASIFVASVFISLNYGATLYINSTLLNQFFSESAVSGLFLLGATVSVFLFLFISKFIEWFGKRILLVIFLVMAALGTLGLAYADTPKEVALSFLLYAGVFFSIYYCFDIFLEELSREHNTGEVRGLYMTLLNLGIAGGPIILALFAGNTTLKPLYLVASVLLLLPILLTLFFLKSHSPKWHGQYHRHIFLPFRAWWRSKSIRHITFARFILESFFAFMVIYMPIYLNRYVGFDWAELGIIFTVMLLPFVIFQWPAGEIADRFLGEKEILIIGFLIMMGSLLFMPFIGKVFLVWLVVLFISRVGASLIEIMTESYFFKHVEARDTGLISIFRLVRPASVFVGTGFGVLAISFNSFEKIFFVLAAAVFVGLLSALSIRDTK
ncbi:MAG: MFS transporter [Minisyncoccia bacterium]